MKKTTLAAGTSPFAHLLGGAAALAGRALGRRAAEEQEDPAAEDEDPDPEADNEDPDPNAETDDEDREAEEEDPEQPEGKGKGKKAATPFGRGFAAANKRARAIFASPSAAGRPDLAAQLAFDTPSMSAAEAIGILAAASAPAAGARGRSLDERMAGRTEPRPGAGAAGGQGKPTFAERAAAAAKKAGVKLG